MARRRSVEELEKQPGYVLRPFGRHPVTGVEPLVAKWTGTASFGSEEGVLAEELVALAVDEQYRDRDGEHDLGLRSEHRLGRDVRPVPVDARFELARL